MSVLNSDSNQEGSLLAKKNRIYNFLHSILALRLKTLFMEAKMDAGPRTQVSGEDS